MSLKDVKPGKYRAKAVEGQFSTVGSKETPAVGVRFEFMNDSKLESIWHVMYLTNTELKDGSTVFQKTFEVLTKLGFNDEKDVLSDGKFDQSYLSDKEMEIVIVLEEKDGKTYHSVQWVNELGGSRLSSVPIQKVLGNLNLKAEMAAARARLGIISTVKSTEDVPF